MNENLVALKEKKFWSSTSEISKHSPNIKGKVQKCYFTFKQKTLKENNGILPTKTLPFTLMNSIKIGPQLSNSLNIQN